MLRTSLLFSQPSLPVTRKSEGTFMFTANDSDFSVRRAGHLASSLLSFIEELVATGELAVLGEAVIHWRSAKLF